MKNYYTSILKLIFLVLAVTLACYGAFAETVKIKTQPFNSILVGPGFDVKLQKGDEEKVMLKSDDYRVKEAVVEVVSGKLKVHMPGKISEFYNSEYEDFRGRVIITYKKLEDIEVRTEGLLFCKDPIVSETLQIRLMGETRAYFSYIEAAELHTRIYGESEVVYENGKVALHKIKSFGESRMRAGGLNTKNTKLTAFGESNLILHAMDELKVTTFGESEVRYMGSPKIKSTWEIGEHSIQPYASN
jgi:hypothetical protein